MVLVGSVAEICLEAFRHASRARHCHILEHASTVLQYNAGVLGAVGKETASLLYPHLQQCPHKTLLLSS